MKLLLTFVALFISAKTTAIESDFDPMDGPSSKSWYYEKEEFPMSWIGITNDDVVFSYRLGFDLGVSYTLPSYTEDGYYIWRQRLNAFLGGRSFIAFQFYWVRVKFYFDFYPAKLTFDNFISDDLLQAKTRCWALMQYWDVLRFLVYF